MGACATALGAAKRGPQPPAVTTSFVWNMHADVNNATVEERMRSMSPPLDHAVSAFLDDVASRGLSDKIMLVATGEMGRTPRVGWPWADENLVLTQCFRSDELSTFCFGGESV